MPSSNPSVENLKASSDTFYRGDVRDSTYLGIKKSIVKGSHANSSLQSDATQTGGGCCNDACNIF